MTRLELKNIVKEISAKIKQMKATRKFVDYGYVPGLDIERRDARHYHVAASLLRGRTLEQIERPADDNPLNMSYVKSIMNSVVEVKHEVVCDSEE